MRRDEVYFPDQLTENDYPFVGSLILSDQAGHDKPPTAACVVRRDGSHAPLTPNLMTTLKRQLNQAEHWPFTITDTLEENSDSREVIHSKVAGFVAASIGSIPLLDTVRGFYDISRRQLPQLAGPFSHHLDQLAGLAHVSLITHHTESTREEIAELARELYDRGVQQVSALRGHVYGAVDAHDIDLRGLSSKHKVFMQKIGRLCIWDEQ